MSLPRYRFIQGYIYQKTGRFSSIARIHRCVQNFKYSNSRTLEISPSTFNDGIIEEDSFPCPDTPAGLQTTSLDHPNTLIQHVSMGNSLSPSQPLSMSQRRLASNIPTLNRRVVIPPLHPPLPATVETVQNVSDPNAPMASSVHLSFHRLSLSGLGYYNDKSPVTPLDQISHELATPPCIPRFPSPRSQGPPLCNLSSNPSSMFNSPIMSPTTERISPNSLNPHSPLHTSRRSRACSCLTPIGTLPAYTIQDDKKLVVKPQLLASVPSLPVVKQASKSHTYSHRLGLGPRRLSYKHYTNFSVTPSPKLTRPGHPLESPFVCIPGVENEFSAPASSSSTSLSTPLTSPAVNGYFPLCQ